MSKSTTAKKTELAPVKETNLPATTNEELDNLLGEYSGAGTSADTAHITIPLIYVLQTNSPQVNKRNPLYVNGAEPGDLWLRNAAEPIVKGTTGVPFQPCHLVWVWVEWRPERQGFVTTHVSRPPDAKQVLEDPNDDQSKPVWVRPNGNLVIETCYVYGLINGDQPYVIPLSSSGYRVAKDWNTDMRNRKHNGKPLPVFGTKYNLTTVLRSNNKGEWFTLGFSFIPVLPPAEEVRHGLDLFKAISSGEKKAEAEQVVTEDHQAF